MAAILNSKLVLKNCALRLRSMSKSMFSQRLSSTFVLPPLEEKVNDPIFEDNWQTFHKIMTEFRKKVEYLPQEEVTISHEREKDSAMKAIMSNIQYFAEDIADERAERRIKNKKFHFNQNLSCATFWLSLFRYSRENEWLKLKEMLRDSATSELALSTALAKVYKYVEKNQPSYTDERWFGRDSVMRILKDVNLSDNDYDVLRVLFNSDSHFSDNRF